MKITTLKDYIDLLNIDEKTAIHQFEEYIHNSCDWSELNLTADEVIKLLYSYPHPFSTLAPFEIYLALTDDVHVAGIATFYILSGKIGEIYLLCVGHQYQNKGLGGMLIKEIEKDSKKLGLSFLTLDAAGSIKYYQRFGFQTIDQIRLNNPTLLYEFMNERRRAREESVDHFSIERKANDRRNLKMQLSTEFAWYPYQKTPQTYDEFVYAHTTIDLNDARFMIKKISQVI